MSNEWYFVSFIDLDMYMRYCGGGIGHVKLEISQAECEDNNLESLSDSAAEGAGVEGEDGDPEDKDVDDEDEYSEEDEDDKDEDAADLESGDLDGSDNDNDELEGARHTVDKIQTDLGYANL